MSAALQLVKQVKVCTKCLSEKPSSAFAGRSSHCRDCRKAYMLQWRQKNPERVKAHNHGINHRYWTLRRYGLTSADYDLLLANQGARCAICFKHVSELPSRLAVDHCHATGVVRGLLCPNCNRGLGMYQDTPELLTRAASYLSKYRKEG